MSASKLSTQLRSIAQTWPTDPFRPNMQLRTFLLSLADHPNLSSESVRAVQVIRNNECVRKYPLSEKTLRPASRPLHYERLVEGFAKSAQGIGRPWWKRFFEIW